MGGATLETLTYLGVVFLLRKKTTNGFILLGTFQFSVAKLKLETYLEQATSKDRISLYKKYI